MTNTVFHNIYRDDSSASSSRNEQISETSEEEDRRVANVETASLYSAVSKAFLACAGPSIDPNHDNSSTTSDLPEEIHEQITGSSKYNSNEGAIPSFAENSPSRMREFSFIELKSATKNFTPDTLLGERCFVRVYKGWIPPSKSESGYVVAVKKLSPESFEGFEEWEAEVNILGRLTHPNVVRLLGYCWKDTPLLLVYEFMQKGSLDNHLFRRSSVVPLSWKLRLMIMLGAARGLAFLHSSEIQIIHRDFKTANILLDGNYNAKLSGFGLAKHGPTGDASHVTTRVMGTYGYAAPEYIATGHLYVKSDVYGFGAVLLEMLTGKRVVDRNRPGRRHHLVNWMKPYLSDPINLSWVMDQQLANQYASEAAIQAAKLTRKCLESDPRFRPSMNEVVECLERIQAIESTSKEPQSGTRKTHGYQRRQYMRLL